MESVLHPSSLHFLTEIYPNKSLTLFFGKQLPDSPMKDIKLASCLEDEKKLRKQQRRQTLPAPSVTMDEYLNDGGVDYQDKNLPSKRYQRWSWTASSTVLPMETIQEEDE